MMSNQSSQDARTLIERFLSVAHSTARRTLPMIREAHEAPTRESSAKSDGSLVTATDHAVERLFLESFKEAFPSIPVVAEESEAERALTFRGSPTEFYQGLLTSQYLIIMDPIDGTKNFVQGKREFCTAAALVESSDGGVWPIAGLVAIPIEDRMWLSDGHSVVEGSISTDQVRPFVPSVGGGAEVSVSSSDRRWLEQEGLALKKPWVSSGSSVFDMTGTVRGDLKGSIIGAQRLWDLMAPLSLAVPLGLQLRDLRSGDVVSRIRSSDLSTELEKRGWGLNRRFLLAPPSCSVRDIVR